MSMNLGKSLVWLQCFFNDSMHSLVQIRTTHVTLMQKNTKALILWSYGPKQSKLYNKKAGKITDKIWLVHIKKNPPKNKDKYKPG